MEPAGTNPLYPDSKYMGLSKQAALISCATKTLIYEKQNEAARTYLLQIFVQSGLFIHLFGVF